MCLSAIVCVRVTVRSFISMTMMPQIDTCLAILVLSRLLWRSGGCVLAYRGLGKDLDFVCECVTSLRTRANTYMCVLMQVL